MQSKLFNAQVACPIEGGCDSVLNSDYAQLFGIPLSAFGAHDPCVRPCRHGFSSHVHVIRRLLIALTVFKWRERKRQRVMRLAFARINCSTL